MIVTLFVTALQSYLFVLVPLSNKALFLAAQALITLGGAFARGPVKRQPPSLPLPPPAKPLASYQRARRPGLNRLQATFTTPRHACSPSLRTSRKTCLLHGACGTLS